MDFVPPLRFQRSGANDQHAADAGLAGENLGDADALDRLAQAHVVGQNRAANASGKGDSFELIRQQLDLQKLLAERMPGRVLANLRHPIRHVQLEKPPLDQLLGVGINRNAVAQSFQSLHAIDQPPHVVDRPVGQRTDRFDKFGIRPVGQLQPERKFLAVKHVDERLAVAIRLFPRRSGKTSLHAMQHVQNVLARAERVRAEVGTRAERIAALFASQRHSIGLARKRAGDRVVGPRLFGIRRPQPELFSPRPILAIAQSLFEQLLLAQGFDRPPLVGRSGQPQRRLLFQHQRNRRADVLANRLASRAIEPQPILGLGHRGDGHHGIFSSHRPRPATSTETGRRENTRRGRCRCRRRLAPWRINRWPSGPKSLARLNIGESGKPVFEGEFLAFLGLHDGRLLRQ